MDGLAVVIGLLSLHIVRAAARLDPSATRWRSVLPKSIMSMRLLVRKNPAYPLAKIPTRGSAQAAGYDLYACEDALIPKGGRAVVQTGIHIALPEGHYGRVAPRSGLSMLQIS